MNVGDSYPIDDMIAKSPIEPKRAFRWLIELPGVRAYMVQYVRQTVEDELELGLFWPHDAEYPDRPAEVSGRFSVKFLDVNGRVTDIFDYTYAGYEELLLNLDYSSASAMTPRVILKNVKKAGQ